MKSEIPFSLVIPAHGRPVKTRRLLESIEQQSCRFEVILVDDATPKPLGDTLSDIIERLGARVTRLPTNRGPSGARNAGVEAASHPIIGFTDNDCVLTPNWAERIWRYTTDAPKRFAGVGGRTLARGNDVFSRYYEFHKILDPWYERGRYLYIVTCNAAFRRSALLEVGGFDETLRKPGGEDPGLCFNLADRGYQFAYDPEAVVYHDFRPGFVDFAKTFFRYGAGCRRQVEQRKYRPTPENIASTDENESVWRQLV